MRRHEEKERGYVAKLRSRRDVGSKIVDASFTKIKHGYNISVKFHDWWNDQRKLRFEIKTVQRTLDKPIKEVSTKRSGVVITSIVICNKGTSINDLINWVAGRIRRTISGSKKEVLAYKFFMEISKGHDVIGKPVRSTKKQDILWGTDIFVPVIKRDNSGWVAVPVDIKSDPFYQAKTTEKNKALGRKISTLCFSTKRQLYKKRELIERWIIRHGRRQKPFNLNITTRSAK